MNRAIGITGWSAIVLLGVLRFAALAGVRVNFSPSVPLGVYWVGSSSSPTVGNYVAVCPPKSPVFETALERGYIAEGTCRTGYGELIKVLAATEGSSVATSPEGVRINGALWPLSVPRTHDAHGRELPQRAAPNVEVLGHHAVWLMSEHSASGFDARYFGPLERNAIVATATPLFTW